MQQHQPCYNSMPYFACQDSSLTVLRSLIAGARPVDTAFLTSSSAIATFLAPTDAALNAYVASKNTTLAALASDTAALRRIIIAHTFPGYLVPESLTNGERLESALGVRFSVGVSKAA